MPTARSRDRLGRPVEADDPAASDHGVAVDDLRDGVTTVAVANDLLERGFPFAAHEVFEARWKNCPTDERELWQGLAQWAVAITHTERGNDIGAQRLRERAGIHLREPAAQQAALSLGIDLTDTMLWLSGDGRLPPKPLAVAD